MQLATVWGQWLTIQVCDQFGNHLDAMYSGCCVEEFSTVDSKGHRINQNISEQGTYQDPVGWIRIPPGGGGVVDKGSDAADEWPNEPKLLMESTYCEGQGIPVKVCGHLLEDTTARKACHRQTDCTWVVCPDGTVIV